MREEGPPGSAGHVTAAAGEAAVFLDRNAILDRLFGNVHLLRELVHLFFEDCPPCLAAIRAAIRQGDAPALRRSAHLLRGSVANFGPSPAYEAAGRLEALGRAGDLEGAEAAYDALDQALQQLQPLLAGLTPEAAL